MSNTIRIQDRTLFSSVDGPGLRTVLWFQGCPHACVGCHNPDTHAMEGGFELEVDDLLEWVRAQNWKKITLSGGDPFAQAEALFQIVSTLAKEEYSIWVYTGYLLEDIKKDPTKFRCLAYIDVLVDGPYIEALRNPKLEFRGSSNQIIYTLD